jgi:hypothetical protein
MGSWIDKNFNILLLLPFEGETKPILFFPQKNFVFFQSKVLYWCVVYTFESTKIVKCWALLHIMVHLEGCGAKGWDISKIKGLLWGNSLGPHVRNVPHLWTLPIIKHEMNIFISLNIKRSQGVRSETQKANWTPIEFYFPIKIEK